MEQICYQCKQLKKLSEYQFDRRNKNGHKGVCRTCIAIYAKLHPENHGYINLKKRRERIRKEYGFGGGFLWRYGLKTLIKVFSKYNYQCHHCFTKEDLTIHHIDGSGRKNENKKQWKFRNNNPENLILLCRSCHSILEGKIRSANLTFY